MTVVLRAFDSAELAEMRAQLDRIEAAIKPEVVVGEPLSVAGFAKEVGRGSDWVYDQISARLLKVLPGGKPYRIPHSELLRYKKLKG